ncbi:MAG TPA: methyltransferase domain-containing protein [Fodinibius sp.]|nr:methyltransferase domain-containing protein [Fodinibius sp.]
MVDPLSKDKLKSVYNKVASRYDWQHSFFTLNADQKGRKLVVSHTINSGDQVIDAGAGTGTTALMAAQKAGSKGKVTLYDFNEEMLNKAREKAEKAHLTDRLTFRQGDIEKLPFEGGSFDVGLSTYSMCPLYKPSVAAKELYRVIRAGGKIGIAHSIAPQNAAIKKLSEWVENIYWKIPELSLGCRAVEVLPTLESRGGKLIFKKKIGVPLWPFLVFVVEKPKG